MRAIATGWFPKLAECKTRIKKNWPIKFMKMDKEMLELHLTPLIQKSIGCENCNTIALLWSVSEFHSLNIIPVIIKEYLTAFLNVSVYWCQMCPILLDVLYFM